MVMRWWVVGGRVIRWGVVVVVVVMRWGVVVMVGRGVIRVCLRCGGGMKRIDGGGRGGGGGLAKLHL